MKEAGPNGNLERAIDRVRLAQHLTTYIKHAGTVDFLLIWSAGTFYIRALAEILSWKVKKRTGIKTSLTRDNKIADKADGKHFTVKADASNIDAKRNGMLDT